MFAALTSILAKVGITGVESNLGTAIRTIVVLVMAWLLVLIKKKTPQLKQLDKRSLALSDYQGLPQVHLGCVTITLFRMA